MMNSVHQGINSQTNNMGPQGPDGVKAPVPDTSIRQGKCHWWSRRTFFERCLVTISVALFLMSTILVFVNVLLEAKLQQLSTGEKLCTTPNCMYSASSMLSKLDRTVEPCQDFYQFACGTFLEENVVPDDHYHLSLIQTMSDDIAVLLKKLIELPIKEQENEAFVKVKRLYTSCMNTSNVEDGSLPILVNLLSQLGEWPALKSSWNKSSVDLEKMIGILMAHNINVFFSAHPYPDGRHSQIQMLHITPATPLLSAQYYLNTSEGEHELYLATYRQTLTETMRLLGAEQTDAVRDVEAILQFETDFANLSQSAVVECINENGNLTETDDDSFNNRMNLTQMEENFPGIRWRVVFQSMFDQFNAPRVNVDFQVVVHCDIFVRYQIELIRATSPRTIASYLSWRLVIFYMPFLDIHFRRIYYDFRRTVPSTTDERTFFVRWKECMEVALSHFGVAMTAMFVGNQVKDQESEDEIKTMVSMVKSTFISLLHQQKWLDDHTRNLCKEKVDAMEVKIGYPDYILIPEQLEQDYEGLEISDEHYLENVLRINKFTTQQNMVKLMKAVDESREWIKPLVVNAFYDTGTNTVTLPIGILRPPVFHKGNPKSLNYGALGVIIGHEITHGFDSNGRTYDKVGNLTRWWPEEMIERFKDIATCLTEQYSQYPIDYIGQNVNGNQTLDENICDNAGVQQAYTAYKKYEKENGEEARLPGIEFTNDQMFFLKYAQIWCEVIEREGNLKYLEDVHSPGKYRANGALINSPQFAASFNCPIGSPMNPAKKCRLWG